jgi:hypothetical protein
MQTSYFARLKYIKYPVAICRIIPDYYKGPCYNPLAPTIEMLFKTKRVVLDVRISNIINVGGGVSEEYKRKILGTLNPHEVVEELKSLHPEADENEITLLCYEAGNRPCHRHHVAEWLTAHGYETKELEVDRARAAVSAGGEV